MQLYFVTKKGIAIGLKEDEKRFTKLCLIRYLLDADILVINMTSASLCSARVLAV
jgi:hypothetical protein